MIIIVMYNLYNLSFTTYLDNMECAVSQSRLFSYSAGKSSLCRKPLFSCQDTITQFVFVTPGMCGHPAVVTLAKQIAMLPWSTATFPVSTPHILCEAPHPLVRCVCGCVLVTLLLWEHGEPQVHGTDTTAASQSD